MSRTRLSPPDCSIQGSQIAKLLSASWRPQAPNLQELIESFSGLDKAVELLLASGAAGLLWWQIKQLTLCENPEFERLKQAWLMQVIYQQQHEQALRQILPIFGKNDIEAVLVKGWSVARRYPAMGLRPSCDLDFCVPYDKYEQAKELLDLQSQGLYPIDLHLGFTKFYEAETEDVFARSRLILLDELEVRVLSPEDELRFLCIHFLKHGAVRPIWLADIALIVEELSSDFNWELCLKSAKPRADWILATIGLAHHLLGANIEHIPLASKAKKLPPWLIPAVLNAWGKHHRLPRKFAYFWRQPLELAKEFQYHWPNPVEATLALSGPFNHWPRWPFQLGDLLTRATGFSPRPVQ